MKKTLVLFLAMMAVFAFGVCAIELDTAENAAEVVAEDAVLAADASVELKPGLNIYTGTTAAFDFEGIDKSISQKITVGSSYYNLRDKSIAAVSYVEFETKATASNASNMAIMLTGSYPHFTFERDAFAAVEAGRPVRLSFNYCSTANGEPINFIRNGLNVTKPQLAGMTTTNTNGSWVAYTADFTSTADATNGGAPTPFVDDTKDIKSLVIMKQNNNSNKVWIDDLSLVPYYKLSYDLNGGTGAEIDSVYFYVENGEAYTNLNKGVSITKDDKVFAGWALTPDATPDDIITELYPVAGSDVTLYAVYKDLERLELNPGINIWTGTTKPYTFDGDEATVDTRKFVISGATVVDKDSNGNNSLRFNAQFQYMALKNELFPVIEVNRPVHVSINVLQHNGQVRLCAADHAPTSGSDAAYGAADVWTNNNDGALREFYIVASQKYTFVTTNGSQLNSNKADDDAGDTWKKPYQGSSFANLYLYKYSNNNYGAYYDDIFIAPYYAITFDNNGGIGSNPVEYFYAEAGTTYTIKTPANFYTKDGKPSLGWALTPDATEEDIITSITVELGKDITLYAVYDEDFVEDEVKPGLNMFTGTEDALTFDGEGFDLAALTHLKTNSVTVETKEVTAGDGNKALTMNARNDYISFANFPKVNVDRPFSVALDIFYSGQVRYMAVDNYDFNNSTKADSIVIYGKSKTAWTPLTYTISGSQTNSTGTGGHLNSGYQQRQIPNIYVYMYSALAATENSTYIDNLKLIPHYKVNYNVNGGTGSAIANEYFYVASGSTYTLKNTANDLVKGDLVFAGWALTPDATVNDVVTKVTPELGKDVTVYAVYAKPIKVTFMKDGEAVNTVNTFACKKVTVSKNQYTSAGADSWYLSWVNADNTTVYNTTTTFEEDTVLYAVKRSKNPVIGENFIVNGDAEGEGFPVNTTGGKAEIVDSGDATYGKVIKFSRDGGYNKLGTCINWETGRKYRIEYDIKTPITIGTHYCPTYGGKEHGIGQGSTTANTWKHFASDYTHTANADATADDVLTLYVNPMNGVENVVYYDNIKFIPYHKVTFNANGAEGTAPAVDFTLDATYTITAGAGDLTKDGFYLAGWATSADGEVVESVDTVVGEDIELFAVWAPIADENAPESDSENFSMRAGDKAGMRFYASVTASQRNSAVEYGFVVARADVLEAIGYDNAELKLGLDYNGVGEGKLYVKGAAYTVENDEVTLDKYIEINDEGDYIFAAVCTGIDVTDKTQVTTKFVIRPYLNIGSVYAYGKPVVKSLYEVAQAIDTTELPEELQNYVAAIIATAEAAE